MQHRLQLQGSGDREVSCVGKLEIEREAGRRTLPKNRSWSQVYHWTGDGTLAETKTCITGDTEENFCDKVVIKLVFWCFFI